jgi:tRNA (guanine37-N1)-methyltransferase
MLPKPSCLHIQVITLFPDIFTSHLSHLPISRAVNKGLLQVDFVNLRDFAIDKRGTVDSPPYGGGPGMILRPEPIFDAINFALSKTASTNPTNIIFLTPKGEGYDQSKALQLSEASELILVCGRYEGMDQRVMDYFVNHANSGTSIRAQEVSVGKYVLSGGEVAAMVIMESTARLIPGAIENREALIEESFNSSQPNQTEHPQYSRPEKWRGLKIPEALLTGHHANIRKWKDSNSKSIKPKD